MKRQEGRSKLQAHNGNILEMDEECDQYGHICVVCVCVCVGLWMTLLEAPSPLCQASLGRL